MLPPSVATKLTQVGVGVEGGSTAKGMDGVAADFRRRKVFPNDLLDIPTYLTLYKRHLSVYP